MTSIGPEPAAALPLRTITHVYDSHDQAADVASTLAAAGVSPERIVLVADGKKPGALPPTQAGLDALAAGVAWYRAGLLGAAAGLGVGIATGLLMAFGLLRLPGVAPGSGWLAVAVIVVGGAAALGMLIGPLAAACRRQAAARLALLRMRRGGAVVSVRTMQAEYDRIEAMMQASQVAVSDEARPEALPLDPTKA